MNDDVNDGLRAVFLANRQALLRFLVARGAGEDAEDLLQDLWLRVSKAATGPIAAPMSYLYRSANAVMIDRFRSARQRQMREREWAETRSGPVSELSESPSADRIVAARQSAALVVEALDALPARASAIFRRHRIDEITQRQIAEELGISVSTVEGDLRQAYRALAELRERLDED